MIGGADAETQRRPREFTRATQGGEGETDSGAAAERADHVYRYCFHRSELRGQEEGQGADGDHRRFRHPAVTEGQGGIQQGQQQPHFRGAAQPVHEEQQGAAGEAAWLRAREVRERRFDVFQAVLDGGVARAAPASFESQQSVA